MSLGNHGNHSLKFLAYVYSELLSAGKYDPLVLEGFEKAQS